MQSVLLNRFNGMITDIDPTHLKNNAFQELINWQIEDDKTLVKIPGYKKWSEYWFDTAVNNITQLIRTEDRNIFAFTHNDIYRIDSDKNVNLLKADYPQIQVEPYDTNNAFSQVRSVVYNNIIWCVDGNLYPFFVYNLSDEAGINLNVWAKIVVTGSDTIEIQDANDPSLVYKTITIPASQNDGTIISIKYNDGQNIYMLSSTWAYKFNYSDYTYDIVLRKQVTPSPITQSQFKTDVFGVICADGSFGYNYSDFLLAEDQSFWIDFVIGLTVNNDHPIIRAEAYAECNNGGTYAWAHYKLGNNVFDTDSIIFNKANFELAINGTEVNTGDPVDISENLNVENEHGVNLTVRQSIPESDAVYSSGSIYRYGAYLYYTYIFRKDNKLYVAMRLYWYEYLRYIIRIERVVGSVYYTLASYIITHPQYPNEAKKFEGTLDIAKVYDIDNGMQDITIGETYTTIRQMWVDNDYDELIRHREEASIPLYITGDYGAGRGFVDAYAGRSQSVTNSVTFETPYDSANYSYVWEHTWQNFAFNYSDQVDPEYFNPYITEYNADDWQVKMHGTPGRPYVKKGGTGSITGDYEFSISYVTTLDTQSETYRSEIFIPPTFSGENADVYWGFIPDDYYGYTFLGIRIYAREVGSTDPPILVHEVDQGSDEWNDKHAIIDDLIPINSVLNVKPYFPKCKYNGIHLERYVITGDPDSPNNYYFSEVGDPNNNPLTNVGILKNQDKDIITGFTSIFDRAIFFKNNFIYAVVGDLAQPQGTLTIAEDYGCIAPDTIVTYKNTIVFVSYAGICLLDGNKVIEVSRGIINNWLFQEHTVNEIKNSFAYFDVDQKEYRLFIGSDILVFDLKGDFYIEQKLNDGHQYTAVRVVLDNSNNKEFLFSTTENYIYRDRDGKHFDGRKRWAYLKSKKFKRSEITDPELLQLFKLNAVLNNPITLLNSDKEARSMDPETDNYVETRVNSFFDKDIEFALLERSSWDAKISDMELIFE